MPLGDYVARELSCVGDVPGPSWRGGPASRVAAGTIETKPAGGGPGGAGGAGGANGGARAGLPDFPRPIEIRPGSADDLYCGFEPHLRSGGLFVATPNPAPLGALFRVRFRLPGWSAPEQAVGRVDWVRMHSPEHVETPSGMGLALSDLRPGVEEAVDRFLARHESIFFDGAPLDGRPGRQP